MQRLLCRILLAGFLVSPALRADAGSLDLAQAVSGARRAAPTNLWVEATGLHGKVLCGYQGWFRCPGDAADMGWIHWSHTASRIAPETLCFEMWPDMSEYGPRERFVAPGFTHFNGSRQTVQLGQSATVQRHFEWMRDYGIDGAWMQQFLVDLPGGLQPQRYASRLRVLAHARAAARKTGRVWGSPTILPPCPRSAFTRC